MKEIPLCLVAALDDEVRVIRSRLNVDETVHVRPALFVSGLYETQKLILVRTGVGVKAMEGAMSYCFDHYKPSFCLHVGYCGGADPKYQPGDLLIASKVVDADTKKVYKAGDDVVAKAVSICEGAGLRARAGSVVTVNKVVSSPHEKAFVGTQYEAEVIDMESSAFAVACEENNVEYLVIRAVLDPLDHALPDLADALDKEGKTDGMALAGHLIKSPRDLLGLPRLQFFASEARRSITSFVDAWCGIKNKEES